jgi:hypothetical protein
MVSAGLLLSRQGPCGLPALRATKSRPTPRRRSDEEILGEAKKKFQNSRIALDFDRIVI